MSPSRTIKVGPIGLQNGKALKHVDRLYEFLSALIFIPESLQVIGFFGFQAHRLFQVFQSGMELSSFDM